MVRIAVVGVGWAGSRHAQAAQELKARVSITALVDDDDEHLRAVASDLGSDAKLVSALDEVLDDGEIDAVSICTPHALHAPQAIRALEAGKHVLVEKPMATSVAEADRMLAAADANDRRLYVAESAVYEPLTCAVRELLEARAIGAPLAASFAQGFRAPDFGYDGRRRWLTVPELGGTGTWMLHGVHSVARIRHVFGEITTVYLAEHHGESFRRADLEATMTGVLTTTGGLAVSILQSCEAQVPPAFAGFVVHGESGSVHAHGEVIDILRPDGVERRNVSADGPSAFVRELEAFADYVETGRAGPTTGAGERQSLAVVEAGYESARSGRSVEVPGARC
ncbi:MAG: Gfo/Idh/MocA family protein [Spirochaetota bacterium]